MEVKIDRSTLPADQQVVIFETYEQKGLIGMFVEADNLFIVDENNWELAWHVFSWEPHEIKEE